jgi:PAS domain S-box-containing protein
MTADRNPDSETVLIERIRELEARLQESEETLDAIRRGEVDALVVGGLAQEHRIYTLESADRPYRVLIEQIQEGALTLGMDGTILYCNRRLAGMLGLAQERVIGQLLRPLIVSEDRSFFDALFEDAHNAASRGELTLCAADGARMPVYMSLNVLRGEEGATLLCGVLTDLTEQKQHLRDLANANARLREESAERERIEEVLRQSQKMEAVGQLTGGLAHDFNNLLTGITGSLELMQIRIAQGRVRDVDRYVNAAQGAAKRAAALTHRLLAFSRRQTLAPKPTDTNRLVSGMEELVRRTVGPEITVEVVAAGGLWPTLVDPGQLENARASARPVRYPLRLRHWHGHDVGRHRQGL